MNEGKDKIYEFGEFRLDVGRRSFTRLSGETVALTPKVFDTLRSLVERPGRVVEKAELMEAVWPNTAVEESNLSQNIYTLRRALEEGGSEQRYIGTVPGRGYQFVADVREAGVSQRLEIERSPDVQVVDARAATPRRRLHALVALAILLAVLAVTAIAFRHSFRPQSQESGRIHVLAVLPFKPLSTDSRDETLELGMADSLISQLSNVRNLSVRPLTLVRRFRSAEQDPFAAGRALDVEAVLDGHIQRSGPRIRVSARLLRVADKTQLWAGHFDEKFTDIFTVQDSISRRVVEELALHLSKEESARMARRATDNLEAYESYLKGRFFVSLAQPRRAIEFFEESIHHDPGYALAHAGLADIYSRLPIAADVRSDEPIRKARVAVSRALQIDPDLAEAHTAAGWIHFYYSWNWRASERAFRRAIQLNPADFSAHLGYAHLLSNTSRHEEALREVDRAIALDPVSPLAHVLKAQFLLHAGRYEESLVQTERALEISPRFWIALNQLGRARMRMGQHEEAIAAFRSAGETSDAAAPLLAAANGLALSGRIDEARSLLASSEKLRKNSYMPPYRLALVQHALGERSLALDLLERAFHEKDVRMVFLAVEPQWHDLRGNPRFESLLERMDLANQGNVARDR